MKIVLAMLTVFLRADGSGHAVKNLDIEAARLQIKQQQQHQDPAVNLR